MSIKKKDTQLEFDIQVQPMDTDTYIYKSHNLIESGYNFTLNEQRLTYLGAKKLKPKYIKSNLKPSEMKTFLAHEELKDLRIHVNEFKNEFNLKSGSLYSDLSNTASSLKKKELKYLQDDGSFVEKSWVITCKYNEQGKYVELTFHPDLILDLLVLKGRFGKMNFNSAKAFKTSYDFRIYELLQNYAYKGFRHFELEDFRYKLGIYEDSKYSQYKDFKKYVLLPSLKTINSNTNLNIELKEIRYGRKVGALEFTISEKKGLVKIKENESIDIPDLSQVKKMQEILGIKVTAGQVAELTDIALETIREKKPDMSFYEYIQYEVERVKDYGKRNKIKNPYGIIKTALGEYWKEEDFPNYTTLNKKQPNEGFNNFEPRPQTDRYNYLLEQCSLGYATEEEQKEFDKLRGVE